LFDTGLVLCKYCVRFNGTGLSSRVESAVGLTIGRLHAEGIAMIGTGEKGARKPRLSNWVAWAMALGLLVSVSPALAAETGPDATPSSIDLSGSWRFKLDNAHLDGTASDFGRDDAKPGDLTPAQERAIIVR
jgi:hypothetical protein